MNFAHRDVEIKAVKLDESTPSFELIRNVGGAAKPKVQNWTWTEVMASQKCCMSMEVGGLLGVYETVWMSIS